MKEINKIFNDRIHHLTMNNEQDKEIRIDEIKKLKLIFKGRLK